MKAAQTRLFADGKRAPEPLTILSYGMGQQSTAILLRLLHDPGFENHWAPGRLLVLAADTGDEEPATYDYLRHMCVLCERHGVELVFITAAMGFHTEAWKSLIHHYRSGRRIGSKAYPKTCSHNLKVLPQLRYLAWRIAADYGLGRSRQYSRTFYEYAALSGEKVRFLIGISVEEADRRISNGEKEPKWHRECIEKRYPLTEMNWDRARCLEYILSLSVAPPIPSACRRCPFKTERELLLMARTDPAGYEEWVELERAKRDAHAERFPHLPPEKNFGVWPHRTLPEVLESAEREYGHLSTGELEEMRMSRGYAVGSCY